jgi:hypothetical protein
MEENLGGIRDSFTFGLSAKTLIECRKPEISEQEFVKAYRSFVVDPDESIERQRAIGLWKVSIHPSHPLLPYQFTTFFFFFFSMNV